MFTIFLLYTIVMLSMFLEQRQAGEEDHDEDFLCRFGVNLANSIYDDPDKAMLRHFTGRTKAIRICLRVWEARIADLLP